MKFLFEQPVGGEIFRLQGFANALTSMGHECYFWQNTQPAYDVFDIINPDVFIGTTFNINKAIIECVSERPNLKVILKGSNFGESNKYIDLGKYPIVSAQKYEIENIKYMLDKTGRPNYIFCHYHDKDLERTMGFWTKELGIKTVALPNAADILMYNKGTYRQELASDVCFVGGYWPYKAINLDRLIVPLCNKKNLNIKIWGNQPWFVPQYLGVPENSTVKDIYASSKVCPNVSEPHSLDFGFDVVERPFKIISSGGFCLMDDVIAASYFFDEDEIGWYNSSVESSLEEMIDYYLTDDGQKEAQQIIKKGMDKVLSQHTYHHRAEKLISEL